MTHQITLDPAGRTFEAEADEPILSAALRAGIMLPYGCRDGACGSCKSRLLEGRVVQGPHQLKALSLEEEAAGLILPCCATPLSDCRLEARGVPADGMPTALRMPTRVAGLERAAPDVMVVRLQLAQNQAFRHLAGQYIDFLMRDGARRSYSIATAPCELGEPPVVELHIRHMPGGRFTDHVFGALKDKEILRAEGPLGGFFIRAGDRPIVMLASGTGFAPIRAMLAQLAQDGNTRPVTLYWGGRRPQDLYRDAWLREQAPNWPWFRYVPVVSEALAEDAWTGRTGFVHQAVMQDLPDLSGHDVYACGAPIVVDSARRDFSAQCALPADAFFADSFTSELDRLGAQVAGGAIAAAATEPNSTT